MASVPGVMFGEGGGRPLAEIADDDGGAVGLLSTVSNARVAWPHYRSRPASALSASILLDWLHSSRDQRCRRSCIWALRRQVGQRVPSGRDQHKAADGAHDRDRQALVLGHGLGRLPLAKRNLFYVGTPRRPGPGAVRIGGANGAAIAATPPDDFRFLRPV